MPLALRVILSVLVDFFFFFSPFCGNSQVKWHEICLSIPAAILEVLNAWENGVLSVEAVQVGVVFFF